MPHAVQLKEPSSKRLFDTATDKQVHNKPAENDASTDGLCEVQHNRRLSKISVKSAAGSSVSDCRYACLF